jgi:ribosomal protein L5
MGGDCPRHETCSTSKRVQVPRLEKIVINQGIGHAVAIASHRLAQADSRYCRPKGIQTDSRKEFQTQSCKGVTIGLMLPFAAIEL